MANRSIQQMKYTPAKVCDSFHTSSWLRHVEAQYKLLANKTTLLPWKLPWSKW